MISRLSRFALALVALSAVPAFAQSDTCATATPISEGTFSGSTTAATNDGDADCGVSDTTPDVWFQYTPSSACVLLIDTCGSDYDSVLSIHPDCPGTVENTLACNDDSCGLSSAVSLAAAAGVPYLIRISGYDGRTGNYVLHVACTDGAGNDVCDDAIEVTVGTYNGTTLLAGTDGDASCGTSATAPDVWHRFTATEDCRVTFDTCGSGYDTVLSIHSACPGTPGNELDCNDDACGAGSRVGVDVLTGESLLVRVSGYSGAAGSYRLNVRCGSVSVGGADAFLGELTEMNQYGRVGDVIACAVDTPLCNAGDEPLDWYSIPDPRHPFMVFNLHRLKAGRLEQIGQSWVKHGFGAAQQDACGLGCDPNPESTRLGVGCSDTYDANINALQAILGPRTEINAWTGEFTYAGSHFDVFGSHSHNAVQHRLQVRDADLDPALNVGAQYIAEVYIVAHDDVDHMNSIAHETVAVSGAPGGTWSFDISAPGSVIGPAIESWGGAQRSQIPAAPVDDGRCILAVAVSDNGNGTWHYEYALYNHDMDRGVRLFSIPVADAIAVTNIGFHAVASHDEVLSNSPWSATRAANAITWSTDDFTADPPGNPLRWGTLYNFRFDATAAPRPRTATLGLWKPGTPATLSGATTGPAGTGTTGDTNCDGVIDFFDIDPFLLALFDGPGYALALPWCDLSNADANQDEHVDFFDIDPFVNLLF